jgi:predicted NUDIX family NTP pyrophosphohydrolase
MKITAGIFLYDSINEKLLITKSFGSRKFEGYSIPKGHYDEDEDETYLATALREFQEECGHDLMEVLSEDEYTIKEFDLCSYKNVNKSLKPYLVISLKDLSKLPLECHSYFEQDGEQFPEISSFHWVDLNEAKEKLHYVQADLISKIKKFIS